MVLGDETGYLGWRSASHSLLRADAKVLSPFCPVLPGILQLGFTTNPAPPGAAAGGAEPVAGHVGAEATAADPKPGRRNERTYLRWGEQEKGEESHVGLRIIRHPRGYRYANIDAELFLSWQGWL